MNTDATGLHGAKVAVIGLGASGRAAALLALAKGGEVYVSDSRTDAPAATGGAELAALGARVEWGIHDVDWMAAADLVVVSPGIPPDAAVLRALDERGVPWISEPELAFRFFDGPLIAVTGTNGKTTTTLLVAHLLKASGFRAAAGGNVGGGLAPAACELALRREPPDWYVIEMSSFQLAGIERFRPDIGVVTNLSPDHLDRYVSVEEYYADKARIFATADTSSRWVLPDASPAIESLVGDAPGHRYRFSLNEDGGTHAFVKDGVLTLRVKGDEAILPVDALPILGAHNRLNALAAALCARLAGASPDGVALGLRTARPLPHRLEPVVERRGILWVNDSKATNVAATESALNGLSRPVILLLGGKDKGEDFRRLRVAVSRHAHSVIVFGAAAGRLASSLEGTAPLLRIEGSLEEVVRAAADRAREGDVVLLSPACSSFDMFGSYEERGLRFAALVRELL
jgi:UDP-N-acetylmuramoylalanine--D-glutamate ligase